MSRQTQKQVIHISKIPYEKWATNVRPVYSEFRALRGEIAFVGDCKKLQCEILAPGNITILDNLFQVSNPHLIPFELDDITAVSVDAKSADTVTTAHPDVPVGRLYFKAYSIRPTGTPYTTEQQLETPNSRNGPYFKMTVTNTSTKS